MFVDPCIIVQYIKKNQQDATMYQNFITPYLYEELMIKYKAPDTVNVIKIQRLEWLGHVVRMNERTGL
jgi:hypothetical protein